MKLLQAKLARYDAPQKAKALGVYPYFREIESDQESIDVRVKQLFGAD